MTTAPLASLTLFLFFPRPRLSLARTTDGESCVKSSLHPSLGVPLACMGVPLNTSAINSDKFGVPLATNPVSAGAVFGSSPPPPILGSQRQIDASPVYAVPSTLCNQGLQN